MMIILLRGFHEKVEFIFVFTMQTPTFHQKTLLHFKPFEATLDSILCFLKCSWNVQTCSWKIQTPFDTFWTVLGRSQAGHALVLNPARSAAYSHIRPVYV